MGRKSRNKRGSIDTSRIQVLEERRQKRIGYSIFYIGSFLLIWTMILLLQTFISTQTLILILLASVIIGVLCFHLIWRRRNFGAIGTLFFGIFLGMPIPFGFISTNHYFRSGTSISVTLPLLEAGTRSNRRSSCRTPYAIIEFHNIKKQILFPCEFEKTISNYPKLTLEISNGYWGYSVITGKRLNK
ncbi:MAG: hypothetical protein V4717_19550 [Bacteroidota bacterium]